MHILDTLSDSSGVPPALIRYRKNVTFFRYYIETLYTWVAAFSFLAKDVIRNCRNKHLEVKILHPMVRMPIEAHIIITTHPTYRTLSHATCIFLLF